MIFMIILVAISLLLCVGLFICGCKTDEDGFVVAGAFFGTAFIATLISFLIISSSVKMDTMQVKAIIDNPQGYTYQAVVSNNMRLLRMQAKQGTIFSFHNNDEELRILKPVDLSTVNNASKFKREDLNINVTNR